MAAPTHRGDALPAPGRPVKHPDMRVTVVPPGVPQMTSRSSRGRPLVFVLIVSGTMLGIAGTDLVLPTVPSLPALIGGTPAMAQLVLAAFVAGAALGLLLFGELGARFDSRLVLCGSLAGYGLLSLIAVAAPTLDALVAIRFVQGAAGAAPAVFAPGMIRLLFDERRALRAIGLLGSLESLMPALAPIAGLALFGRFGWQGSFWLTGLAALTVSLVTAIMARRLPRLTPAQRSRGYPALLRDPVFLRYAVSHAFSLGGLLVFVFGAPAVITDAMGSGLSGFVAMQATGVTVFVLGANLSGRLAERVGIEPAILRGTLLSALGLLAILLYALVGGRSIGVVIAGWVPVNMGFGLRGPPGFLRAVVASRGDDARGAALVVLAILSTSAAGTALVAPFITMGLVPLGAVAAAISLAAVAVLLALPRLDEGPAPESGGHR